MPSDVQPVNLTGGQCDHCGQYGHNRKACGLLKTKHRMNSSDLEKFFLTQ
ncbi:uncharacterized protein BX664DRAFT_361342 [Halteromyces radiatus]|nr:uncharacterized protein BX664DRAFT_361342 [Halteromyces radiatus]KAI8083074.1 hypothetical protein BX664DRAFT_361342 [Halteromyces radiatus]